MIRIEVHHVHHIETVPPGVEARLDALTALLRALGVDMSAALDRLKTEVAETKTVAQSAVALLNGLGQQIRELKDDPAALEALADELDATQGALAEAITANTETPAPTPEP